VEQPESERSVARRKGETKTMDAHKSKAIRAQRRKYHVRKNVRGTAVKPRLSVYRSNLHIYAQLIDDETGTTLAAASTNEKGSAVKYGGNIAAASVVGKAIAEKAVAKGIKVAAFDRGPFHFHGRMKALARAATDAGLVCTGAPDAPKDPNAAPKPVAARKVKKTKA
jgi:large subunit ribosomal protein L18